MWLVAAPSGVGQKVWDAVATAALSAMDKGRRALFARAAEEGERLQQGGRQLTMHEAYQRDGGQQEPPAVRLAAGAGRVAAAELWRLLQDFAGSYSGLEGLGPGGEELPPDAPFLHGVPGRRFAVRVRADAPAGEAAAAEEG